jgi:hypothetical protein
MDDYEYPQWPTTADERVASNHDEFEECEAAMQILASKMHSTTVDKTYSTSKQWGQILRARVLTKDGGLSGALRLTCWKGSGASVQMFVEVEGCGPQQVGC